MNRTVIYLATAALLALVALVVGLPKVAPRVTPPPLDPAPVAATKGSLTMQARLSHKYVAPARTEIFATVDLAGADVPGSERTPVNLAVVIDRSGSMSGLKLAQAKQAAKHLVSLLRPADRLTVVHYGSDVKHLNGMRATVENKEQMLQYIDGIWDDGGTNIGAGLTTAKDLLLAAASDYKVSRVILISDGQPTEGVTDEGSLVQMAREIRQHGLTLSSIGVGNDFNENLMQAFAEVGAGAYGYLQDASQLATIFQKDLQRASTTVARKVALSFELPDGVTLGEVYGHRAETNGRTVRVLLSDFAAGQAERVVVRLWVDAPEAGKSFEVTSLKVEYEDLVAQKQVEARARLAAATTDDRGLILAGIDKQATVFATRAQTAWNLNQAAEKLRRGDRDGARALLQENAALYRRAADVAGEAAVAVDKKELAELEMQFNSAADEGDIERSVKSAKVKARKDFGLFGSTY